MNALTFTFPPGCEGDAIFIVLLKQPVCFRVALDVQKGCKDGAEWPVHLFSGSSCTSATVSEPTLIHDHQQMSQLIQVSVLFTGDPFSVSGPCSAPRITFGHHSSLGSSRLWQALRLAHYRWPWEFGEASAGWCGMRLNSVQCFFS